MIDQEEIERLEEAITAMQTYVRILKGDIPDMTSIGWNRITMMRIEEAFGMKMISQALYEEIHKDV